MRRPSKIEKYGVDQKYGVEPNASAVIVTLVTEQLIPTLLPLFLSSLYSQEPEAIQKLIIGVTDKQSLQYCSRFHDLCILCEGCLSTQQDIVVKEKSWKHVTWDKLKFLSQILDEKAKSRPPQIANLKFSAALFCDIDVVWLSKPTKLFSRIEKDFNKHLAISSDSGNTEDLFTINTGVIYAKRTTVSMEILGTWYKYLRRNTESQQKGLYSLLSKDKSFLQDFRRNVEILPCDLVNSGCCWRHKDEISWKNFKIAGNSTISPYDGAMFHAACCPPGKAKFDRLFRMIDYQELQCKSDMLIMMTASEQVAIHAKLYHIKHKHSKCGYLELGSGGSTPHFANLATYAVSIENNRPWYEQMVLKEEIKCLTSGMKLNYKMINSGNTRSLGKLLRGTNYEDSGRLYVENFKTTIESLGKPEFDLILIDGRYRISSALAASEFLKADGIVFVHDFTRREKYKILLKYFDVIFEVDTLVMLKIKDGMSDAAKKDSKKYYSYFE